jgi:hypothetical protein
MKQTAVEWLFAHLLPHLDWSKTEDRIRFRQLEQEAKAMEKEQIIDTYNKAAAFRMLQIGEQYYNDTFS